MTRRTARWPQTRGSTHALRSITIDLTPLGSAGFKRIGFVEEWTETAGTDGVWLDLELVNFGASDFGYSIPLSRVGLPSDVVLRRSSGEEENVVEVVGADAVWWVAVAPAEASGTNWWSNMVWTQRGDDSSEVRRAGSLASIGGSPLADFRTVLVAAEDVRIVLSSPASRVLTTTIPLRVEGLQ